MQTYLLVIWQYIKNLKLKHILIVCAFLLMLFSVYQCRQNSQLETKVAQLEQQSKRHLNNYQAMQDSVKYYQNRLGRTVAQKQSLQLTNNELETYNQKLKTKYQKTLDLNKDLKNTLSLIQQRVTISDTFNIKPDSTNNPNGQRQFSQTDSFDRYNSSSVKGQIDYQVNDSILKFNRVKILTQTRLSLNTAIIENNNKQQIKVTANHPNATITNLNNVQVVNDQINKPKVDYNSVRLGIFAGIASNLTQPNRFQIRPAIGVGVVWTPKILNF